MKRCRVSPNSETSQAIGGVEEYVMDVYYTKKGSTLFDPPHDASKIQGFIDMLKDIANRWFIDTHLSYTPNWS